MSGTSVIRDILWLALPSGDACPAVDGVDIHQYVRVSDISVYVSVCNVCSVCSVCSDMPIISEGKVIYTVWNGH